MQVRRLPARSILALVAALALIALTSYAIIIPVNGKPRQIPLAAIYTTSEQEGTKPLYIAVNRKADGSYEYVEPYGASLHQIFNEFPGGPSHVFLVRGRDINEAVRATADALLGGRPAETLVQPEPDAMQSEIWLVAYFGTMGSLTGTPPGGWSVQAVEVRGKTLRVTFLKRLSMLKDIRQYFVWVPLGKLQPNSTYNLELFDADQGDVTLSRRVRLQ